MATLGVKLGTVVSVFILLLAYYYRRDGEEEMKERLNEVLSGLLRAEMKVTLNSQARVAVGFGSCRDVIADGLDVMRRMASDIDIGDPEHVEEITNIEELSDIFTYFFQHGAAAERFVNNVTLFNELVEIAESLPRTRTTLGGNAPVMANRFHMEGAQVLLAAMMSERLQEYMSKGIIYTGDVQDKDDIHLLLEYNKGSKWNRYISPRANRFIVHNDQSNPHLASLEGFQEEVRSFDPDLLVVGGLQMMDNFPFKAQERWERLDKLRGLLADLPRETLIHFEMASFAEEACLRDVIDNVVYQSDSLGMNEQELPNLFSMLTNGSVVLLSDPHPRIATTLDHMRAVYKILNSNTEGNGRRKLTRLHVHTLAYQAILTTRGSPWKNTMSAAAKASLVANRHTCGSDQILPEKAKILMDDSFSTSRGGQGERVPFRPDRPVSCWGEGNYDICIAPVLVCTQVVQTGGGGDNISSAGLVLQI